MFTKKIAKFKRLLRNVLGGRRQNSVEIDTNGERSFLNFVARVPPLAQPYVVVDVGANVGLWAEEATAAFAGSPLAAIHCIEPIATYADQIAARFAERDGVVVHRTLLSDTPQATVPVYKVGGGGRMYLPNKASGKPSGVSTGGKQIEALSCGQTTGDELLAQIGLPPHFIKIDCDGHDCHVLFGFRETLRRHRPIVQFEYCDFWIQAGSSLREACRFLDSLGYVTFMEHPDRLERFEFRTMLETYEYANIVAVPKENDAFGAAVISLG